jgi:hypothetical protein
MEERIRMRSSTLKTVFAGLTLVLSAITLSAQAGSTNVSNWTVPPYRAQSSSGGLQTMVDISDAAIFVAITTCRVFDTRDPVGPYGGPRLIANTTRNFDIDSGPCTGIPAGSAAFSMNFGSILPDGDGFVTIWPAGAAQPTSSFMNTQVGEVVANAAIVPASSGGSISIFPNTGMHMYGDINGYFMDSGGDLADNITLFVDGSDPNEGTITGSNRDAASSSTTMSGVRGFINTTQTGPSGVLGQNLADTGANYALRGINDSSSPDAAGVYGTTNLDDDPVSVQANFFGYAGVRGMSAQNGVLGIGEDAGVNGALANPAGGAPLTRGRLGTNFGFDPSVGASPPWGVFAEGNIGASGTKYFLDPHPTDPSKVIGYISLEGPEAGTYFRGRGRFDRGVARIPVPEHFRMVTDPEGLTVQITPIGGMATVGVLKLDLNEIVVESSRNLEFSYLVQGVRATFKERSPVFTDGVFRPESADATMPGWFSAEQKRRLIANGTYRADGTVNLETARQLGWDKVWKDSGKPVTRPTPE